jgi:tripartite motif-containing protein 71
MESVRRWLMGAACLLLLAAFAGCGGPAGTVGEFASYGTAAGQLREPFGIAADQRTGDVYVVDTNNWRVEKFTSTGRFLMAWGWGVADGRTRAPQTCTRKCFPGIQGAGAGQLQFPEGIAIDEDPSSASYGDLYVADIDNVRVQKFSPAGRFVLMFGGGVNHAARARHNPVAEDVCPVNPGDVCGAGTEGTAGGQLQFAVEGSFIAVAPNATVWIGQRNRVKAFTPEGIYKTQIKLNPEPAGGNEAGGVSGLAINTSGDLYVIRHGITGVNEYTSTGKLLRTLEQGYDPAYDEGPTPTVTLDPAGNVFIDVYAHYQHRVDEYSPTGAKLASFDKGQKAPPAIADKEDGLPGMAYDEHTKQLYLVNADINLKPRIARIRAITPPQPQP